MSHDDFDFEPMRGLPAPLPAGERLLWQGSPDFKRLAIRAYHVRKVGYYFLALIAWRIGFGVYQGHATADILMSCSLLLLFGALGMGVLATLAYFSSRSTVYTITSRRVLLRHGIAVPMTMNIPFTAIDDVTLALHADRSGDLSLTPPANQRVGYLITWPHLRPGFITRPRPSLRCLCDAEVAASALGQALALEAGENRVTAEVTPAAAPLIPRPTMTPVTSRSPLGPRPTAAA